MVAEYGSPGSPGGPSETPEKPAPSAPQGEDLAAIDLHLKLCQKCLGLPLEACPAYLCIAAALEAERRMTRSQERISGHLKDALAAERRATEARIEAICAQNFEAQSDLVDQIEGLQNKLRTAKRELTEARAALDAANERLGLMGDPCKYVPVRYCQDCGTYAPNGCSTCEVTP